MMPGMKGTEVLAKIREHSHIPVIMLTARGDPADRIIGLELGADDYVPKPFTPRELVARIRAILRRTASQESPVTPLVVGPLTVNLAQRRVWVTATKKNIELTSTEFSLLKCSGGISVSAFPRRISIRRFSAGTWAATTGRLTSM